MYRYSIPVSMRKFSIHSEMGTMNIFMQRTKRTASLMTVDYKENQDRWDKFHQNQLYKPERGMDNGLCLLLLVRERLPI